MGSLFVRLFAVACVACATFGWRHPGPQPAVAPAPLIAKPEPVQGVKAQPAFLAEVCPPLKKPSPKAIPVLTDLYYRVGNPDYFADPQEPDDLVTHVHELSHGVSNRLHASTVQHGIYLLEGRGIILKHPRVTIEQVASAVPGDQRGQIFDLYMVRQRKDWNNSPIYLLDEWNAYIHGALAHGQLGLGKKRKETYDFAREMERYCRALVSVVEQRDPEYPDMDRLKSFVDWQSKRFQQIAALEPKQ